MNKELIGSIVIAISIAVNIILLNERTNQKQLEFTSTAQAATTESKEPISFSTFQMTNLPTSYTEMATMASGDFDGDGDIDLAIYCSRNLCLIENKIPQKR